jgi:arylsulfatase A-like enzyme
MLKRKNKQMGKFNNFGSDSVGKIWDKLLELGISEDTLQIITSINGYNEDTLNDVLYAKFGYRSIDQMEEE